MATINRKYFQFFTARRCASAVYAVDMCLCVCHILVLYQTAKRRISKQRHPIDSPGTLAGTLITKYHAGGRTHGPHGRISPPEVAETERSRRQRRLRINRQVAQPVRLP